MKSYLLKIKKIMRRIKVLQKPYSKIKVHFIEKKRFDALHKYGYEILNEMTKILNKNEINAFCAFGTLLGIIRDGGFINTDDDIDMGIVATDNFSWNKLEECLGANGFKKKRQFELENVVTEQTYEKKGVCIDFFLYQKNKDCLTANVYWIDEERNYADEETGHSVLYRDCPLITGYKKQLTHSIEVVVPENSEAYLIANYGEGWLKPDPNFKPEKFVRTEDNLEAHRIDF